MCGFTSKIGVHGIQIRFEVGSNSFGGTFLPEVAPEQGWSHQETIVALVKKAGYKGRAVGLFRNL
jgi:AMMECR1 domain-containing protein